MFGALWPEISGVQNLGAIRAVVVSAMVFATALGPGITGTLIDRGIELPQQLFWMAGWSALATAGRAWTSRRVRTRQARTNEKPRTTTH